METIEPSISFTIKLHAFLSSKLRYVDLLWALPTPQTIVAVGSAQEMSHLGSVVNHAHIVVSKFRIGTRGAKVIQGQSQDSLSP